RRKPGTMFDSVEALLGDRADDLPVAHKDSGGVGMVGIDAKNEHVARPGESSRVARRIVEGKKPIQFNGLEQFIQIAQNRPSFRHVAHKWFTDAGLQRPARVGAYSLENCMAIAYHRAPFDSRPGDGWIFRLSRCCWCCWPPGPADLSLRAWVIRRCWAS